MKVLVSLALIFVFGLAAGAANAQEKKPPRQIHKVTHNQSAPPDMFEIIHRVAQGRRFESQDAKNVSFTLKPNRAFITIEF